MTQYTATYAIYEADTITAHRYADQVELKPSGGTEVYLDPAPARAFARGILALADEIDGGEAPALKRIPQVGDRVRVVRNAYSFEGAENVGRVGVLKEVTSEDAQSHRVSFTDDSYGWWCAEVEYVGADTRPKVGDRLRVTKSNANSAPVREGQIITVHATDYGEPDRADYIRALLGDADDYAYYISLDNVEPVTDAPAGLLDEVELADWERALVEGAEAAGSGATPSAFARYVNEAKTLLADTDHTGADVITLALELDRRS
ncbi:hypothetical protein J7I94_19350 [Streptomyces sp. ISL-12]|uniref:hypothetical protein n=1 Tax=Streptomyces sp. ISL-12 TaxID=2819177 RepID=UPI001BE4F186|nr:hypothetical protein [Streptomyces sp. ISL-12]MBT2412691.1 hypothetical protein [Streptomyces sp. ISL-12]